MKGDFSRDTYVAAKHYSSVLMQQGRVQVDADWNEQQAISGHRMEAEARDVIGHCGTPELGKGFEIRVLRSAEDLVIFPGCMYVDGILCELEDEPSIPVEELNQNEATIAHWPIDGRRFKWGEWVVLSAVSNERATVVRVKYVDSEGLRLTFDTPLGELDRSTSYKLRRITTYLTQADYPEPTYADKPSPSKLATLNLVDGHYLVYLDVWQRHITALEDSHIRQKALGAPDTTTRAKTVWQVKILPIKSKSTAFEINEEEIRKIANGAASELAMNIRKDVEKLPDDDESRGRLISYGVQARKIANTLSPDERKIFDGILQTLDLWKEALSAWNNLTDPSRGTLNVRTRRSNSSENPCSLPPGAGYQRPENQLYRVEIHKGSEKQGGPTFKWSRHNGSVVASVEEISGAQITIKDTTNDVSGFPSGQWVEVLDDNNELNALPGELALISDASGRTTLKMETPVTSYLTGVDKSLHPKIRRWDHPPGARQVDIPLNTKDWVTIDDSIEVKFSEGTYRSGDYWLIPVRTATGDVEWPPYDNPKANPIPQLPLGIKHHYCALGWLIAAEIQTRNPPIVEIRVAKDLRTTYIRLPTVRGHILDIRKKLEELEKRIEALSPTK